MTDRLSHPLALMRVVRSCGWFFREARPLCLGLGLLAWLLLAAGCGRTDDVRVKLQVRPSPDSNASRLRIEAQIAGEQTGLRFKWFTVSGQCTPQDSAVPGTVFRFADGVVKDRVSVEVWRDDRRVAAGEVDVAFDAMNGRAAFENIRVEITTIPPREPGGDDTRADIAGRVIGSPPPGAKIVLYARAYDNWFVQPTAHAKHLIGSDNTWSSWTHTGINYAALLVRADFDPIPRLDLLPSVGGNVLARTMVEGKVLDVDIEITTIPPQELGGSETRADIGGRIKGEIGPNHKVAVYAYSHGLWWVQPVAGALHTVRADGTWSTWTHTGTAYAVLLVTQGYIPDVSMAALPPLGGFILSEKTVDGTPQP